MQKLFLSCVMMFVVLAASATEYHVSIKTGNNSNKGTVLKPFKTISKAVEYAFAGDTITVHEGIYREWINPIRGRTDDDKRIVYRAAPGENVEIKGSEVITGWKKARQNSWKVIIPNTFFKDYNPYKDSIFGDWFHDKGRVHHTGEVFLNGKSLYEKESIEKVWKAMPDKGKQDVQGSSYTWYCESDEENTTIWANFQNFNPNEEFVEISTRKTVFYPKKPGINFITISGFKISQAATQWGAPTAEQVGMIATHWNKGWIIENNSISDSKCSGITLGKEKSTGHNVWSEDKGSINNDGNIHYIEVIFKTLRHGWNKNNIGSHIVRNNSIFNCEQAGIAGSMGAVFSTIENNHIYNIYTKRQFDGAEIGGIKFHAAIDATLRNNRIHNARRGIWLDWMTQGTRVSSNLLYDNDAHDLFLEVNHGPYIVDNNILLSPLSIDNQSQGGAYVHNLIAGKIKVRNDLNRFTPYHYKHETGIKGLSVIKAGDDRYYSNMFLPKGEIVGNKDNYGLGTYEKVGYPVSINNNLYYGGSKPYKEEKQFTQNLSHNPMINLIEREDGMYLNFILDESFINSNSELITTSKLGQTLVSKARFENADGSELLMNRDFFGNLRSEKNNTVGPFNNVKSGFVELKVW